MEAFEISYEFKQRLTERLTHNLSLAIERLFLKLWGSKPYME